MNVAAHFDRNSHFVILFSLIVVITKEMSKINATYGEGFYIDKNVDYLAAERQMQKDDKKRMRRDADSHVIRQRFMLPFDLSCDACGLFMPRNSKCYMNRKRSGDYTLRMPNWDIAMKCRQCGAAFVLTTDYETAKQTGGYKCKANCTRRKNDNLDANLEKARELEEAKKSVETAAAVAQGDAGALEHHNEQQEQLYATASLIEAQQRRALEKQMKPGVRNEPGLWLGLDASEQKGAIGNSGSELLHFLALKKKALDELRDEEDALDNDERVTEADEAEFARCLEEIRRRRIVDDDMSRDTFLEEAPDCQSGLALVSFDDLFNATPTGITDSKPASENVDDVGHENYEVVVVTSKKKKNRTLTFGE